MISKGRRAAQCGVSRMACLLLRPLHGSWLAHGQASPALALGLSPPPPPRPGACASLSNRGCVKTAPPACRLAFVRVFRFRGTGRWRAATWTWTRRRSRRCWGAWTACCATRTSTPSVHRPLVNIPRHLERRCTAVVSSPVNIPVIERLWYGKRGRAMPVLKH